MSQKQNESYQTVAIVADVDFGPRLSELGAEMYVWVRDSPANLAAVETLRESGVPITSFRAAPDRPSAGVVMDILSTVDLHHGPYSQARPWRHLRVFGAEPTASLRSLLEEMGFGQVEVAPNGFTCSKREMDLAEQSQL